MRLRSAHNQALAVRADGEYSDALRLDREVHRGLIAALGTDHPDTLRSAYCVAVGLRATGDLLGQRDPSTDRATLSSAADGKGL
jgi:hypothetical protein